MKLNNTVATLAISSLMIMSTHAFAGDVAAGKQKSATCTSCHGTTGISANPMWPNLAGQHKAYIVKQLKAFKSGERKDPSMKAFAAMLSDADMENVAAYYASLK